MVTVVSAVLSAASVSVSMFSWGSDIDCMPASKIEHLDGLEN